MRKILLLAAVLCFGVSARADDAGIAVSAVWGRASLGQSSTTAVYMKIENHGAKDDTLLSIVTPMAAMAHVHESAMKDGVMQMRPVNALTVKSGASIELKPGGLHVMVMGLKAPLKAGDVLPLALRFKQAGEIAVKAEVRGLDAK